MHRQPDNLAVTCVATWKDSETLTWYVRIEGVDSVMTVRATGLPEFQFLMEVNETLCFMNSMSYVGV
jgi:hypothetical protein